MMRMIDQGWWTTESRCCEGNVYVKSVSNLFDCPVSSQCQDLADSRGCHMSIACHLVSESREWAGWATCPVARDQMWAAEWLHVWSPHVSTHWMKTNIWLSLSSDGLTETKLIGNSETWSHSVSSNITHSHHHSAATRQQTSKEGWGWQHFNLRGFIKWCRVVE